MAAGANDRLQGSLLAKAALQGLADAILADPTLTSSTQPAVVNALLAIYHELCSERDEAAAVVPSQRQIPWGPAEALRALTVAIEMQTERLDQLCLVAGDILAEMTANRRSDQVVPRDVDEGGLLFPDVYDGAATEDDDQGK